jgi:hypothetical protein
MGYLKRKRTKRRGKKGTKKYRGGMLSSSNGVTINPESSISNSTSESTPGAKDEATSNADAALLKVSTAMDALKSAYGEGPTKDNIESIKTALNTLNDAIAALPAM